MVEGLLISPCISTDCKLLYLKIDETETTSLFFNKNCLEGLGFLPIR